MVNVRDNRSPILPPESLKLGSSNLHSAKDLHKDLQMKYTELQVSGLFMQVCAFEVNDSCIAVKLRGMCTFFLNKERQDVS